MKRTVVRIYQYLNELFSDINKACDGELTEINSRR